MKYSFLFNLLYFSPNLLTFGNLTLFKEDLSTLANLFFLFFNFKTIACVRISLFKCIFFKLTMLNSTFLLYNFSTRCVNLTINGFSNLTLLNLNKYRNLYKFSLYVFSAMSL